MLKVASRDDVLFCKFLRYSTSNLYFPASLILILEITSLTLKTRLPFFISFNIVVSLYLILVREFSNSSSLYLKKSQLIMFSLVLTDSLS